MCELWPDANVEDCSSRATTERLAYCPARRADPKMACACVLADSAPEVVRAAPAIAEVSSTTVASFETDWVRQLPPAARESGDHAPWKFARSSPSTFVSPTLRCSCCDPPPAKLPRPSASG